MDTPVAITAILTRQFNDGPRQWSFIGTGLGRIANRGTREMERPADPSFSMAQAALNVSHCLTTTCRA